MFDILHQLIIKTPTSRVYHALTDARGLASWWTRDVRAQAMTNSIAEFIFDHGNTVFLMKIIKLIPNRSVVWYCIGGHPEWESTQISFDLEQSGKETILHFAHRGWKRTTGIYPKCNFDWARYLVSLRRYLEKGQGYPAR